MIQIILSQIFKRKIRSVCVEERDCKITVLSRFLMKKRVMDGLTGSN